ARFATLAGSKLAPGAHGRVTFDPRTGRALLVASDLPPAPAGKAYQLWFIKGAAPPVPGRVFQTDASGRGSLRDQAPPRGLDADTFAVTLEPEQGVTAPTGQIYLVGKIS
ncbi:MAG TPA: anti-sigma factor, partial [Pyrinomonadaceae bacterium]|nr:anti-sigma factor [Pyrinomonadaceae bacterium]